MSKTILVTGGAGFIGSRFVRYITSNYPNYRIIIVDALTYAGEYANLPAEVDDPTNSSITFWYGNVNNQSLMTELISQADTIIHFAAETHVTRSVFDNLLFFETDVIGTQSLANAALAAGCIERFIHISTSEVYGTALTEKMDEGHPLNPSSPYASAKCGADRLMYSYWETYRMPVVIVRPFNNYGPYQHLEKVIPRFVTSVLLGEDLTVHGDGTSLRDFVFVDDTCEALDLILHAPIEDVGGEVFNVASGESRSIIDISSDVVSRMDYDPERVHYLGDRPGQVVRHTGDWAKIRDQLGWNPKTTWDVGIDTTIKWFRENKDSWSRQLWMRHIPIKTAAGKTELH